MIRSMATAAVFCIAVASSVTSSAAPTALPELAPQQTPTARTNNRIAKVAGRQEQPSTAAPSQAAQPNGQKKPSEAEQIARLSRTIEEDTKLLEELKAQRDDPEGEYPKAETAFKELDKQLAKKKKQLQSLIDAGESEKARTVQVEIDELEKKWELAKKQFELAIEQRKILNEKITTLDQKIQKDKEALKKLKGEAPPKTPPTEGQPSPPGAPEKATPVAPQASPAETTPSPTQAAPAKTTTAAPASQPAAPTAEGQPAANGAPSTAGQAQPAATAAASEKAPTEEEIEAREEVQTREQAIREVEENLSATEERIEHVRKLIALARQDQQAQRKAADLAQQTRQQLQEELQQKLAEGVAPEQTRELWSKIAEVDQQERQARSKARESADRLNELLSQLDELQSEKLDLTQQRDRLQEELEAAQAELWKIQNPFTPEKILQWLINHGPKILVIIIGIFILRWLVKLLSRRIVNLMSRSAIRGSREERENRAKTLVGVFQNTSTLAVVTIGILMILAEFGVNVAVLGVSAGIAGLAIAFGAQSLIKDYFYGFVILLENQYAVNDVVKFGDIAGLVERITLRMTVLRDLEGIVHFIPHGQITTVSNLTHGWSRALFDIGVAYKEDVDRVMSILMDLGKEMRKDPAFGPLILEDPTMLGLDQMADSAIIIKFFIKTKPLQQWTVKRELLRRIKKKFDELGIEIPFPHRTIYHRYEGAAPPPEVVESRSEWP